jgi:hypothetical protein
MIVDSLKNGLILRQFTYIMGRTQWQLSAFGLCVMVCGIMHVKLYTLIDHKCIPDYVQYRLTFSYISKLQVR